MEADLKCGKTWWNSVSKRWMFAQCKRCKVTLLYTTNNATYSCLACETKYFLVMKVEELEE